MRLIVKCGDEGFEAAVGLDFQKREMKAVVGLGPGVEIALFKRGFHVAGGRFQRSERRLTGVGGGNARGGVGFESGQDLVNLAHVVASYRQNARTASGDQFNQTLGLQPDQGFADWGAAHAKAQGDLRFGRLKTRRQAVGPDIVLEPVIGIIDAGCLFRKCGHGCLSIAERSTM